MTPYARANYAVNQIAALFPDDVRGKLEAIIKEQIRQAGTVERQKTFEEIHGIIKTTYFIPGISCDTFRCGILAACERIQELAGDCDGG